MNPGRNCGEQLRGGASGFNSTKRTGDRPRRSTPAWRSPTWPGQAALHSDTSRDRFVEDTIGAIAGRSIHAYHTEEPAAGNSTGHHTVGATECTAQLDQRPRHGEHLDEHLDMLMVCHHQPRIPEDFVCRKPDPTVHHTEDVLHDMGAISMIGKRLPGDGPCRRGGAAHLRPRT